MFSSKDLRKLIIPLIIEQVLMALMGAVDTVMVTSIGSAAISGVSLVDSINTLVIDVFTALATGGSIICSQYLGRRDKSHAGNAARQVLLSAFALSSFVMVVCLVLRKWLLAVIFGTVEPAVMDSACTYFLVTAMSYPFIALFGASSALYRAAGNSRISMIISVSSNVLNIIGNTLLIYVFRLGVLGAAISTLVSRVASSVAILICQFRPGQDIQLGKLTDIRPDFKVIWLVLCIGLPTGIENSMFQLGKLVVQSTVSTLGTTAIAANAMVAILEMFSSKPSMAIGYGLTAIVGQCMGAGRLDEAKKYIKQLTILSAVVLFFTNWLIYFAAPGVAKISGMEPESEHMMISVLLVISILKPFLWPMAFTPMNGTRAAGDVKFNMIAASLSMWIFRVGLTTALCRFFGVGLIGIWCGYFVDWAVRSIVFSLRLKSDKWHSHHLIEDI